MRVWYTVLTVAQGSKNIHVETVPTTGGIDIELNTCQTCGKKWTS